jgi:hypothetical protein
VSDDWQLDITLVKNITDFSNPAKLKTAKSNMLFPIDTQTFVDKAPWAYADVIEFELEFIGKRFTLDSMIETNNIFDFLAEADEQTITDRSNEQQQKTYQSVIYEIAKLIKPKESHKFKQTEGLKQLSNQVIELDKNMFLKDVLPSIQNFYITDKIDGSRAVLYIYEGTCLGSRFFTPLVLVVGGSFLLQWARKSYNAKAEVGNV